MNKVQLTLTNEEMNALLLKASKLGYDVTKYIKYLIASEAFSIIEDIPTFSLSKKAEKKAEKALQEYKKGKAIELTKIDDLDKYI